MTLDEAVEKAGALFDQISAEQLADSEAVLRHHGASDEEIAFELGRLKAEHASERWLLLCRILVSFRNAEVGICVPRSQRIH